MSLVAQHPISLQMTTEDAVILKLLILRINIIFKRNFFKAHIELIYVFISVLTWICFWNELCLRIFDAEEPVLLFLAWPLLSSNVDARISLGSIRRICGMVTSLSGCTLPLMKYVLTPEINRNECRPMKSSFHLYLNYINLYLIYISYIVILSS